jgi:hypothetical protein
MTFPIYEVLEATEWAIAQVIRTDADGTVSSIPCDLTNSDYQAYLNKDKAKQSTLIVMEDE